MVSLLGSLGYRARLKVVAHGGKLTRISPPTTRKWRIRASAPRPDTSPGSEVAVRRLVMPNVVSCAGFMPAGTQQELKLSEFDHAIDAQMAHASAVQAQDPPAATLLWQRVERCWRHSAVCPHL